jgi:hypothetical protein
MLWLHSSVLCRNWSKSDERDASLRRYIINEQTRPKLISKLGNVLMINRPFATCAPMCKQFSAALMSVQFNQDWIFHELGAPTLSLSALSTVLKEKRGPGRGAVMAKNSSSPSSRIKFYDTTVWGFLYCRAAAGMWRKQGGSPRAAFTLVSLFILIKSGVECV